MSDGHARQYSIGTRQQSPDHSLLLMQFTAPQLANNCCLSAHGYTHINMYQCHPSLDLAQHTRGNDCVSDIQRGKTAPPLNYSEAWGG